MSSMNGFRLTGDAFHVIAIIILLCKLLRTKSCASGISARSQILFALVCTTRYLDLDFTSFYLSSIKIMYIFCSYFIVFLIIHSKTYEQKEDVFLTEFLIIPCFMMAIYFNHEFTAKEILWTFSIYLEAVAILPQFYMIYKKKEVERWMVFYLLAMAAYRGFYILNWIYRYYTENYCDFIDGGAGVIYILFYFMDAADLILNRVKITVGERGTLLKNNIFFISNNGPLEDRLNLIYEQQDVDKYNTDNQPEVEKV